MFLKPISTLEKKYLFFKAGLLLHQIPALPPCQAHLPGRQLPHHFILSTTIIPHIFRASFKILLHPLLLLLLLYPWLWWPSSLMRGCLLICYPAWVRQLLQIFHTLVIFWCTGYEVKLQLQFFWNISDTRVWWNLFNNTLCWCVILPAVAIETIHWTKQINVIILFFPEIWKKSCFSSFFSLGPWGAISNTSL